MCDGYRTLKFDFYRGARLAAINQSGSFGTSWLTGVQPVCQNYTWPCRAPVDAELDALRSAGSLFVFDDRRDHGPILPQVVYEAHGMPAEFIDR
jgi:hypothetical protein